MQLCELFCIVLLVTVGTCKKHAGNSVDLQGELIYFKPMTEYVYHLISNADLKTGYLNGDAKVGFIHVKDLDKRAGQEVYLRIHTVHLTSASHKVMVDDERDLTKWFSFGIEPSGNIFEVTYPIDEDPEVIALKKGVVGMLSGRLHLPKESSNNATWKYGVKETGTEGPHESSYLATPSKEGIIFNKIRETHPIEYGQASHEKEIHYHSDFKLPTRIRIKEHFKAPHKAQEGFDPYSGLGAEDFQDYNNPAQNEFPEMNVTSLSEFQFLYRLETQTPQYPHNSDSLVSDSLHIKTVQSNMLGFNETQMWNFIRGNLTCIRKYQDKESLEGTHCFQNLVHILRNIPEEHLGNIVNYFFNGNSSSRRLRDNYDRLHVLDALVATNSEYVQDILTDNVILSSSPNKAFVERILMLLISNNKTFSLHIVQTIEDLVFRPTFFPATLQDRDLHRKATMTLGAIASNLHHMGRTNKANQLVGKIEEKIGIHDPWNYMAKLNAMPVEQHDDHHFDTVALVEALGNAGLDRSLDHILSFANSTNTPHILRRAGLHSLRRYFHEKASNVLLSASKNDDNKQVRRLADNLYRAHPYSRKTQNITSLANDSAVPSLESVSTNAVERDRRSIPLIDEDLTYDFSPKPKKWSRLYGNKEIGATIGYSLRNTLILRVRLLSGVLEVDALNNAYVTLHVGLVGFKTDVARADVCFDGAIGLRINPMKEIKCAVVEQFLNAFDRVIQHYINKLSDAIVKFREWLLGPDGLPNLLDEFGEKLQAIPQKAIDPLTKINAALEPLSKLNPRFLPPCVRVVIDLVQHALQTAKDFQLELMEFYNAVSDAILVILYSASEQLIRVMNVLCENIHLTEILTAPHTAIENIYKALVNSGIATDAVIQVIVILTRAGLIGDGPSPFWKRTSENIAILQNDLKMVKEKCNVELDDWVDRGQGEPGGTDARKRRSVSSGLTEREQIRHDVLTSLDETWAALNPLRSIMTPIQSVADRFFDSSKNLKGLFQRLRNSYLEAKSEIVKTLGPNVHKDFPREIRLAGSGCSSNGFYPSTADGFYSHQGVDLVSNIGQQIIAPYSGSISRPNGTTHQIRLVPSDGAFIDTVVYIDNIEPAQNIPSNGFINVIGGTPIGITASNGPCGSNHIHFVVRTELGSKSHGGRQKRSQHSADGTQDSSGYLNDRLLEISIWTRGCDDYRIDILGFASGVGSLTQDRRPRKVDSSPPRNIDYDNPSECRSKRSATNSVTPPQTPPWFHNVEPEIFRDLGLPIPEFGKSFPVDFNVGSLKVGAALDFFERVGLDDIASRMKNVLQSLGVLIADNPCVNPNILTKDQLAQALYKRGKGTGGPRSDLLRRYLSPDDRCPLLQISLPQNTYCHIDRTCLALECCMTLSVFTSQISLKVFARYDPCRSELVIGVYPWSFTIPEPDIGLEQEETFDLNLKYFGEVSFKIGYIVEKVDQLLLVSLSLSLCPSDDECLASVDVLKESAFMLHNCTANTVLSSPTVNVSEYFQRPNLVAILAGSGQTALETEIDEIAKILNLPTDIVSNTKTPCSRPDHLSHDQLVRALMKQGQNTTGTRSELVHRLTQVQKECEYFAIPEFPSSVSEMLYCTVSSDCLRVECCLTLEVATLMPSFTLYIELNACNSSVTTGFESMVLSKRPIEDTDISGEERIGWISMDYSLRSTSTNGEYVIDFGISVCPDDSDCVLDVNVLESKVINVPACNSTSIIDGEVTTPYVRRKRQGFRGGTPTSDGINGNTQFDRSVSFWDDRLAEGNTEITATENMNTRLEPPPLDTDQPRPGGRSPGWVPLDPLLDEYQEQQDQDFTNRFDLPTENDISNIWQGATVSGGGLTEYGAGAINGYIEERALQEIEFVLDALDIQRLKSVIDKYKEMLDKINRFDWQVLLQELQQTVRTLVEDTIDDGLYINLGNEFEARDYVISVSVRIPPVARTYFTPFERSVAIPITILVLRFYVGIGVGVSIEIPFSLNIGEMTYTIGVTPGAAVIGRAGLQVGFVVYIGYEFVVEVLGTDLPITREANYCKFPIEVTDRVDYITTPLVLRLFIKVEIKVWIIRKTIYRKQLWKWSSPSFSGTIKKDTEYKEDYTIPNLFNLLVDEIIGSDGRKRRQSFNGGILPDTTKSCLLEQIPGLDYTEPALHLQLAAADDVSYVTYSYSVGTDPGGNEVVANQLFGGPSAVITEKFLPGVPLFFTVSVKNSGGGTAIATCSLPTYDVTLPGGRVDAGFRATSHPGVLKASAVVYDDSEILNRTSSVGYGTGLWGDQVIPWQDIEITKRNPSGRIDDVFDYFTAPKMGKLVSTPFATKTYKNPNFCARDCSDEPASKCLSFNYDYGPAGTCELLHEIEGHGVQLHQSGLFSHFERLGIGHAVELDHNNLQLIHNNLYYFNIHIVNPLEYENVISSEGILVDFTPPEPGPVANPSQDEVIWEECASFTPEEWQNRCISTTPLPNHRVVIDGKGSMTVFNGHTDLEDLLYTRANKFISANWDGFRDNETSIYGYTWSVGKVYCEDDVSAHIDPHSHLFDETEWNHEGIVTGVNLEDGLYYITVRAFNKAEFGGPMAISVCHTTPYVIDNTPPVIIKIWNLNYDSDIGIITINVNCTDAESKIAGNHVALGRTPRDTYVLDWLSYPYTGFIELYFKVPDGVPVWVKIRAVNNVDLRTTGHSENAILIDKSPPVRGIVYDGAKLGVDLEYFKDENEICANWQNFYDAESGISSYAWAVGSQPGYSDVVDFSRLDEHAHSACANNLTLTHEEVYFSTVVAYNGGFDLLNISGSSNGVMLDLTAPVPGQVYDGDKEDDYELQFSSEPASVSAYWEGFHDPESKITDYLVSVHRSSSANETDEAETIHQLQSVGASTSSIDWHHFHLHHNDYIYVNVRTVNGAQNHIDTESDGYRVDLTPPNLKTIGDGTNLGDDIEYQIHDDSISVNWQYEDMESGVIYYQLAIYEIRHGSKRKIFPADLDENSFETISDGNSIGHTQSNLQLQPGYLYVTMVKAINGAKLVASHETTGIRVDPTPPKMLHVRAGVVDGDHEEILDGYVYQSDRFGIKASWRGVDSQSNIMTYWVAVGTERHFTDIREFRATGPDKGGYISGLKLNLTNDDGCAQDCRPVYFVCVKAQNGAGEYSETMCSSPIKVVEADRIGYVTDGPQETDLESEVASEADVDAQLVASSITITFAGFASDLNGIRRFEWAIGTTPGGEDVQPYVTDGIVLRNKSVEVSSSGISGDGKAQAPVELTHGLTYYSSVRAITGSGDVLESTSDGVSIDQSPPHIILQEFGPHDFLNESVSDTVGTIYQEDSTSITASWNVEETESSVDGVYYSIGSYPYGNDVASVVQNSANNIPFGVVGPNLIGMPNLLYIQAVNSVGLKRDLVSSSLVVDTTAPIAGKVWCSTFLHVRGVLRCHWSGFIDPEGGIDYFQLLLGNQENSDDVFKSELLSIYKENFELQVDELHLQHNDKYYVTVEAVNTIGRRIRAYSKPIIIDDTPPTTGVVVELQAGYLLNATNQKESVDDCLNQRQCLDLDVVCLESVSTLPVAWEPFTDPETAITKYEVAVGTTPFGTQVKSYFDVKDATKTVISNVDLSYHEQVFVSVRGYNEAGLFSTASSNGVYISRQSIGLSPLRPQEVRDGPMKTDRDFQTSLGQIDATWDFSGDPCPILQFEWAIRRIDGTEMQEFTNVGDQTYGTNSELHMSDGETYYILVRGTNALGITTTVRSDGITIKRDPLIPGNVYDGPFFGNDLNFQPEVDVIHASWTGFGKENSEQYFDHTGNDEVSRSASSEQTVDYYEVAVGTDRRYPKTRDNVVPFTNVGTNTSVSFYSLVLQPVVSVYYVTVRAHSVSFATSETSSNGITVGVNSDVYAGEIEIPRFVNSLDTVDVRWTDFESTLKMRFYYIGIDTVFDGPLPEINCRHAQSMTKGSDNLTNFIVFPLQSTNLDTYKKITGLKLQHFETYFIAVIGFDEAGECNSTSTTFTVDNTLPTAGQIRTGPFFNRHLDYTSKQEELQVWWHGFEDPESGIKDYHIRLLSSQRCERDDTIGLDVVVDWLELEGNLTYHRFVDVYLEKENPYFVELRATNNAGGSTEVRSSPILLDLSEPIAGNVIDGLDFMHDEAFHGDTTQISGSFLHLANPRGPSCPQQVNDFSESTKWTAIDMIGLGNMDGTPWDIWYLPEQILALGEELEVTLERDVRKPRVLSGALAREANLLRGGKYEVEILAASKKMNAVTSIVFWDGQENTIGDYQTETVDEWWEDLCACCYEDLVNTTCSCNCTNMEIYQQEANGTAMPNTMRPSTTLSSNNHTESGISTTLPAWQIDDSEGRMSHITPQRSCGLQLIPGQNNSQAVLWCRYNNDEYSLVSTTIDLLFNPSEEWHTYGLHFTTTPLDREQDQWKVELYIDGDFAAELDGIPELSKTTKLVLHVWNANNFIPVLTDEFNPPMTIGRFRNLRLPAHSSNPCRYGEPFRGGSSPAISYMAGVGSQPGAVDIVPFQEVARPCIPCLAPCDLYHCDESCSADSFVTVTFTLKDVILPEHRVINNISVPIYLSVKSVLGNGESIIGFSNGVSMDTTPAFLDYMFYIDIEQGDFEPVSFQSSNSTIKVYWNFLDYESEIAENLWAIGTQPGYTDLQDFTSVGLEQVALNSNLTGKLHNNQTYYVTLKAINGAGILKVIECPGVTVLFDSPIPDGVNATALFSEELPPEVYPPNTMKMKNGSQVGMTWTKADDEAVTAYEYCVGSSEDVVDDIVECIPVGVNSSGSVRLSDGGKVIITSETDETELKITELTPSSINTTVEELGSDIHFNLEPGKTVYNTIQVCNSAGLCSPVQSQATTIIADEDQMAISSNGDDIELPNESASSRRKRSIDDDEYSLGIQTTGGLHKGGSLVLGYIDREKASVVYDSDAVASYHSFVVNPLTTMHKTSRDLKNRILSVYEPTFYLSSLGQVELSGPLSVNITFPLISNWTESFPLLVFWNPDDQEWHNAAKTCGLIDTSKHIPNEGQLLAKVCDTRTSVATESRRKRFAENVELPVPTSYFSRETHFAVIEVSPSIINEPPVIQNLISVITINEDEGTIRYQFEASDIDGDDVEFFLDPNRPKPTKGVAAITESGLFTYTPCLDCTGLDDVNILVKEVQTSSEITPLLQQVTFKILLTEQGDEPEVFVAQYGNVIGSKRSASLTVEQDTGVNMAYQPLSFVIGAFDVDNEDDLTVEIRGPENGLLTLSDESRNVPSENDRCDPGENAETTSFASVPCGLNLPHPASSLTWLLRKFVYEPRSGFYGSDLIQILARDQLGLVSRHVSINFGILSNPCVNGSCKGPDDDLKCVDIRRSLGFDDYSCDCLRDYGGTFCEDYIGCEGSQCDNETDIVEPAPKRPVTAHIVTGIVVGLLAILIIVIVVFIIYKKRRSKSYKLGHDIPSTASSEDDIQMQDMTKQELLQESSMPTLTSFTFTVDPKQDDDSQTDVVTEPMSSENDETTAKNEISSEDACKDKSSASSLQEVVKDATVVSGDPEEFSVPSQSLPDENKSDSDS